MTIPNCEVFYYPDGISEQEKDSFEVAGGPVIGYSCVPGFEDALWLEFHSTHHEEGNFPATDKQITLRFKPTEALELIKALTETLRYGARRQELRAEAARAATASAADA